MTYEQLKLEKKDDYFGRTLTIRLTYIMLCCSFLCLFCYVVYAFNG